MTREQIMADPVAAVSLVIADAERYKRERDEAVRLVQRIRRDPSITPKVQWVWDAQALVDRVDHASDEPDPTFTTIDVLLGDAIDQIRAGEAKAAFETLNEAHKLLREKTGGLHGLTY